MMDKEDLDDDDELNRSGHMSFVVSDPEHRRILEGEIEDPFSPSMSAIDPDADAYLSSLMQQTSPFGSIKSNSRGQSPAYRNRRLRQTEAGDESFLESTDEALSDKELNPKLRTSRTGTRTPSSPLARAVTRASPRLHMDGVLLGPPANSGAQLSLDQILSGNKGLDEGSDGKEALQNPDLQNGTQFGPLSGDNAPNGMSSQAFNLPNATGDSLESGADAEKGKENSDNGRVKVDIVIQDFNVKDEPGHGISNDDSVGAGNPGLGNTSHAPFGHSGTLPVVNGEFQLHDPADIPEVQARSFADWMSSSAEISKLDINPPSISGEQPTSSLGTASSLLQPAGSDLMSTTGTSLLTSKPGDVNVLTSSYTPGSSSSSEANPASPVSSTSPSAAKRSTLLEKRSTLMGDILAKARGAKSSIEGSLKSEASSADSTSAGPSVSFSAVDDVKAIEKLEESESVEDDDRPGSLTSRKELGLKRRPSGMMLSSRIRDSTNLDAPRYSIREMEDMKKNVRMELRIEITNEIKEEYERSAEQEASIYQAEIEELKAALEKEKQEKDQLKSVLDEYVSSFDDIAVSTVGEIQTLKEQNKKLTESQEETQEAFVLLKTRYDELKDLNHKHVENGEIMRKAIEVLKQDYEMSESRFESLKAHADSRMKQASQEMEQARIAYDSEIVMLKTQLGRQDMQMRTLEQALDIKTKEFEQLMQFSEDMIAKLQ
ncbi:Transforming acidic coiled-coil-containing protein 3 [Mortierella sp. NVP85]|nr:Transforming acidic coiled-coil-containing protein 3 [Mortierella sp. NVP85]